MRTRAVSLCLLAILFAPLASLGAPPFEPPPCAGAPFPDVAPGHPLCAWIAQLKTDGITSGCGGGNYCPDAPLTRGPAALLIGRAMHGAANWEPAQGVFAHTLIVKPVPNDAVASGSRLLNTLGDIDDASNDNRYLVWLEPGEYNLSGLPLQLKAHVTLQGATRTSVDIRTTTTTSGGHGAADSGLRSLTFWVNGSSSNITGFDQTLGNSSIRDVTFQISGPFKVNGLVSDGTLESVAVVASGTTKVTALRLGDGFYTLEDVTTYATSADGEAYGIDLISAGGDVHCNRCKAEIGAANGESMPIRVTSMGASNTLYLREVETYAGAGAGDNPLAAGLAVYAGHVEVENSRLEADPDASVPIGIECSDAAPGTLIEVNHSRLVGADASIRTAANGNCTVRVGGSQLKGGAVDDGGSGTIDCVALYGDSFSSPGINSCF